MNDIVKICKIHGPLTKNQTRLNRLSSKGKEYLRCGICRNEQARNALNIKYITTPKKHEKIKVPNFVSLENKSHAYTILNRFKLSPEKFYEMLSNQNNLCAICQKPETQIKRNYNKVKMLSVDHCHTTGKVRGLLCMKCNAALGMFKDSIDNLKSAILYLSSHEDCYEHEDEKEP